MAGNDSMDDVWFVQLSNGNVRAWSLDELDAEFQKGTIDENTLVRQGIAPWSKLSVLLGLDEPARPAMPLPVSSNMAVAVPVIPTLAPFAIPSVPPPPVTTELPDFDDMPQVRSKRGLVFGLVAAALVVCGGVFAFTQVAGSSAPAAASALTSSANASIAQAVAATPPPPSPAAQAPAQLDPPKGAPLTDLQKKALLDADKNRERASKEKRAKAAPPRRAPKSASPFIKNGKKGDPLNVSL